MFWTTVIAILVLATVGPTLGKALAGEVAAWKTRRLLREASRELRRGRVAW
jgi:hypothetical protein